MGVVFMVTNFRRLFGVGKRRLEGSAGVVLYEDRVQNYEIFVKRNVCKLVVPFWEFWDGWGRGRRGWCRAAEIGVEGGFGRLGGVAEESRSLETRSESWIASLEMTVSWFSWWGRGGVGGDAPGKLGRGCGGRTGKSACATKG